MPPKNNTRIDNLLRYLTLAQHSVQDTARPNHKSPDLEQVQSVVDKMKGFDFFNLEETTQKLDCDSQENNYEPIDHSLQDEVVKRSSRDIFEDFSGKIKGIVGGSRKSRRSDKSKRKLNGLFANIDLDKTTNQAEPVNEKETVPQEEPQVLQSSGSERLLSEWKLFESKLNPTQQVDISNFLDAVKDKPQVFKFDTGPFFLEQMEKLNHPEQSDSPQEDEDIGPKKFFDFSDSPMVKRNVYNGQVEDFQKIAKLKSKLIAEYRDHHPMIDYSAILRQIDSDNQRRADKTDDFLDNSYQLNDGSSRLEDVLKPYHSDTHVLSPFELSLNFQLDKQFREIDSDSSFDVREEPKSDQINADVPLHKPESGESPEGDSP